MAMLHRCVVMVGYPSVIIVVVVPAGDLSEVRFSGSHSAFFRCFCFFRFVGKVLFHENRVADGKNGLLVVLLDVCIDDEF